MAKVPSWFKGSAEGSPYNKIMYGDIPNFQEHPKRVCAICGSKPIVRYVRLNGFCKNHLKEAWEVQQIVLDNTISKIASQIDRIETQHDWRNI